MKDHLNRGGSKNQVPNRDQKLDQSFGESILVAKSAKQRNSPPQKSWKGGNCRKNSTNLYKTSKIFTPSKGISLKDPHTPIGSIPRIDPTMAKDAVPNGFLA